MTDSKSYLERLLSVFTEVRRGEGAVVLLMTLNVFLILTAYLIAKVVREPLILAGGGAEIKSYSAALQVVVLAVFLRIYASLVANISRRKLINYVTLFFAACLVVFFFLSRANANIGVVFFIWVGIFSLVVIAQFWSFANDIYAPSEGKRLFVIIQFGASAGGVFGPMLASLLLQFFGVYELLLVSAAILVASLAITNYVESRRGSGSNETRTGEEEPETKPEISKKGAFRVVLLSKYLLMIAVMVLLTNWVNTTGEYILGKSISASAADVAGGDQEIEEKYIAGFYSRFFAIVGAVGLLFQLLFVSRIIKFGGIRLAVMIQPIIALGGYGLIAAMPFLKFIKGPKIAENAADYSLNSTVRNILFLPTTTEQKYKAKVAIDSFFVRVGDVLSALLVFVGITFLGFGIRGFALFNLGLVLIWLLFAYGIGKEHQRLIAAE
jgi:AAA family ATP:ADP antiporter